LVEGYVLGESINHIFYFGEEMPFDTKFQKKLLQILEEKYDFGAVNIVNIFETYQDSFEEEFNLQVGLIPKPFRKDVFYLRDKGFIDILTPDNRTTALGITDLGIDYLHRPCWFVRILKEAVEKSIVNGIGFILGVVSTWGLIKILPVFH